MNFYIVTLKRIVWFVIVLRGGYLMKRLRKSFVAALVVLMLNVAVLPTASVMADVSKMEQVQLKTENSFADLSEGSMLTLLKAVDKIPQEMLDKADQYEIDQFMLKEGVDLKFHGERTKRNVAYCVAAISWAVGTTIFGVLKITKIKKFINAAGGVRKAADALIAIAKGGRSHLNLEKFGSKLIDLSADILGIKEIKDNCF